MSETIFIYNENCVMAGRAVPRRELDRYEDPRDGGDWSAYELSEESAHEWEQRSSPFAVRIAKTIREALA
jgi:hypothetical protein